MQRDPVNGWLHDNTTAVQRHQRAQRIRIAKWLLIAAGLIALAVWSIEVAAKKASAHIIEAEKGFY